MCSCDEAQVVRTIWRKARKEHRCSECGDRIVSGERYESYSILFDGSWDHYNFCASCSVWWTEFWRWERRAGACLCPGVGDLASLLPEIMDEMESRERERLRKEEWQRRNGTFVCEVSP